VASSIIWLGVLNARNGWINLSLAAVGIRGPDWLNDTVWAKGADLVAKPGQKVEIAPAF